MNGLTTTASDPLLEALLRVLIQRAGGEVTVSMTDIAEAARAGAIRTRWDDAAGGIAARLQPAPAITERRAAA